MPGTALGRSLALGYGHSEFDSSVVTLQDSKSVFWCDREEMRLWSVFWGRVIGLEQLQEEGTAWLLGRSVAVSSQKPSCYQRQHHHFGFLFSAAVPPTGWQHSLQKPTHFHVPRALFTLVVTLWQVRGNQIHPTLAIWKGSVRVLHDSKDSWIRSLFLDPDFLKMKCVKHGQVGKQCDTHQGLLQLQRRIMVATVAVPCLSHRSPEVMTDISTRVFNSFAWRYVTQSNRSYF